MDLTTAFLLIVLWLVSISWMSEWMNKWLKYFLNGTVSYHLFSQIISTKFSLNKMGFFLPNKRLQYNILIFEKSCLSLPQGFKAKGRPTEIASGSSVGRVWHIKLGMYVA